MKNLCRLQGWFYFVTGIWPLVHGESFQMVTGFKTSFWLAQIVGALIALIGAVLLKASYAAIIAPEIVLLGAGAAMLLGIADVVIVPLPETTSVYWADAVAEFVIVGAWLLAKRRSAAAPSDRSSSRFERG